LENPFAETPRPYPTAEYPPKREKRRTSISQNPALVKNEAVSAFFVHEAFTKKEWFPFGTTARNDRFPIRKQGFFVTNAGTFKLTIGGIYAKSQKNINNPFPRIPITGGRSANIKGPVQMNR
jgi:hypothetical protein